MAISIEELRGLSASGIEALPDTVDIVDGDRTVGRLVPVKRSEFPPLKPASPELVERAIRTIEAARAARTPEQEAAITEILREIGAE